jgi:hypothetical protein
MSYPPPFDAATESRRSGGAHPIPLSEVPSAADMCGRTHSRGCAWTTAVRCGRLIPRDTAGVRDEARGEARRGDDEAWITKQKRHRTLRERLVLALAVIVGIAVAFLVLAVAAQQFQGTGKWSVGVSVMESDGPVDDGTVGPRFEIHAVNQSSRPISLWRCGFFTPRESVIRPVRRHFRYPVRLKPGASFCDWMPSSDLAEWLLLFGRTEIELVGFCRGPLWQTYRAKPVVFSVRRWVEMDSELQRQVSGRAPASCEVKRLGS